MKKVEITASENIRHYYRLEVIVTDEEYETWEKAPLKKRMAMVAEMLLKRELSWDDIDDLDPEYGEIEDLKMTVIPEDHGLEVKEKSNEDNNQQS